LLDSDRDRQKEFIEMQHQLNKNQDMLSKERGELEELRKQFLEEMDNKLR